MAFAIPQRRTVRALHPPGLATQGNARPFPHGEADTRVYGNQNTAAETNAHTAASATGFVTIHQSRSTFVVPLRCSCR